MIPCRIDSAPTNIRCGPRGACQNRNTSTPMAAFVCGYRRPSSAMTDSASRWACSRVALGLRCPMTA